MKRALLIGTIAIVMGCTPVTGDVSKGDFSPEYGQVDTKLLTGELVNLQVSMRGARNADDVIAFNDCAAAQYALIRGAKYVRRVKNDVDRSAGTWVGNGVYTLSDAYPGGRHTIDAEVAASACRASNVPMV